MKGHKGGSETGGKSSLRLGNAGLGTSHFGGISGQKMVHGLVRGQFGNRRQYPEGITGEHDDIGGMPTHAGADDIGYMGDRIRGTGIFSERVVIHIYPAAYRIDGDVFEDGAEPSGGLIDFWLRFPGKLDDLG